MSRPIRVGEVWVLSLLVISLVSGAGVASGGSVHPAPAVDGGDAVDATDRGPATNSTVRAVRSASTGDSPPTIRQSQPAADNTVTRIEVADNGSARFAVRIRTRLETDAAVAEYRSFQESFRENTSDYLGPFRRRIEATVSVAEEGTGRQMTATAFRASTTVQELPRRWGVITFAFRWEGLAWRDGDALVVGDIFQGGYYLTQEDTLEIQAPPGYGITSASPNPDSSDDRTATWRGQEDFENERPQVRMERPKTTTTTTVTTSTTTDSDDSRSLPMFLGGAGLVAVLAAGGVLLFVRRQNTHPDDPPAESTGGDGPTPAGRAEERGDATADDEDDATAELDGTDADAGTPALDAPDDGSATETGSDDDATTPDVEETADDEDDAGDDTDDDEETADEAGGDGDDEWFTSVPDPEVLTEHERVLTLLSENGGRIKQGSIAEACDWSPSKTSRVISAMVEEGTIRKLRIGRENLIERADDADDADDATE